MNESLILIISNALTGIASFLVSKRMSNAQTDNQILKNLELAMGVYQTLCEDMKNEIISLNIKIQDLEKKIDELHEENQILKRQGKSI
jgi:peptidoglycan hydrolase CwlO-like protein